MKDYTDNVVLSRPHPVAAELNKPGRQVVYRFSNNYGASVVSFPGSYGYEQGLLELCVLQFTGTDDTEYRLCYSTPITDDVLGRLTEDDVRATLAKIEELPSVS